MRISGFSFARNAQKLFYPVAESIRSILPICDEFVIAIGRGDSDDATRELVEKIDDPKIRIIDTDWDDPGPEGTHVFAHQTNIALRECSGDWCFYLQSDEVVHEKYLPIIKRRCEELLGREEIEGLLFSYKHFWGDFDHYLVSHAWYPREIRIVRNHRGITSWRDAQSFRKDGAKLVVGRVAAEVFHYGWVRPPRLMRMKQKEFSTIYQGASWTKEHYRNATREFDYGSLEICRQYPDSYPAVLRDWVKRCDWQDRLRYTGTSNVRHKHDRLKYRVLTWIEQHLLAGNQLGGFKNYILKKDV